MKHSSLLFFIVIFSFHSSRADPDSPVKPLRDVLNTLEDMPATRSLSQEMDAEDAILEEEDRRISEHSEAFQYFLDQREKDQGRSFQKLVLDFELIQHKDEQLRANVSGGHAADVIHRLFWMIQDAPTNGVFEPHYLNLIYQGILDYYQSKLEKRLFIYPPRQQKSRLKSSQSKSAKVKASQRQYQSLNAGSPALKRGKQAVSLF